MIIIVGLGNIGEQYEKTRHNLGFIIVDHIAKYYKFNDFKFNFKSLISTNKINTIALTLVKPQTFMNLSGDAVLTLANFYKIDPQNIILVHDDVDLQFLQVKYKTSSGDGGQKGVRDIQLKVGTNLHKIKVGIGRPNQSKDIAQYVLGAFNQHERQEIEIFCDIFAQNLELLLNKQFPSFIKALTPAF
ncbi:Aminoacyl-tRNA hydrolase [Candidatus Hepatincolaceae symbiont of Richtersius coronifer]